MAFYREKNFTFQLASQEGQESFEIWKAWEYKNTPLQDPNTGEEIKFPIRKGQLVGQDGLARDVQTDIKFMKRADFKAQFPWYHKRTTYVWECIIDGQQYAVRFAKTAHRQLQDKVNMAYAMGVNPFAQVYYQKFDRGKPAAQMYEVGIVQNTNQTQQVQQQQPQNTYQGVNVAPGSNQQVAQEQSVESNSTPPVNSAPQPARTKQHNTPNIDGREKQLVDAIKEKYKGDDKLNSTQFIEICKKNGVSTDRAKELFVNEYE